MLCHYPTTLLYNPYKFIIQVDKGIYRIKGAKISIANLFYYYL